MDNILKLLLGVLSVAGLIAMVTPTNLTVAPPVPVAADIPAVEGPAQISDPALLPEEETVEEAEDDLTVYRRGSEVRRSAGGSEGNARAASDLALVVDEEWHGLALQGTERDAKKGEDDGGCFHKLWIERVLFGIGLESAG